MLHYCILVAHLYYLLRINFYAFLARVKDYAHWYRLPNSRGPDMLLSLPSMGCGSVVAFHHVTLILGLLLDCCQIYEHSTWWPVFLKERLSKQYYKYLRTCFWIICWKFSTQFQISPCKPMMYLLGLTSLCLLSVSTQEVWIVVWCHAIYNPGLEENQHFFNISCVPEFHWCLM